MDAGDQHYNADTTYQVNVFLTISIKKFASFCFYYFQAKRASRELVDAGIDSLVNGGLACGAYRGSMPFRVERDKLI